MLQLYVEKQALEEGREGAFAELKNLVDTGDIVGVTGMCCSWHLVCLPLALALLISREALHCSCEYTCALPVCLRWAISQRSMCLMLRCPWHTWCFCQAL